MHDLPGRRGEGPDGQGAGTPRGGSRFRGIPPWMRDAEGRLGPRRRRRCVWGAARSMELYYRTKGSTGFCIHRPIAWASDAEPYADSVQKPRKPILPLAQYTCKGGDAEVRRGSRADLCTKGASSEGGVREPCPASCACSGSIITQSPPSPFWPCEVRQWRSGAAL